MVSLRLLTSFWMGLALICGWPAAGSGSSKEAEAPVTAEVVKRICNNNKFKVASVDQMMEVIVGMNQNESKCPDRYRASFRELDGILKLRKEQLCDDLAFDMIKQYHFRFISPLRQLNKKPSQYDPYPREVVRGQLHPEPRTYQIQLDDYDEALMAPIPVRHFFLKFMLQVSAQCKRNLLANLEQAQLEHLSADDLEILDVLNEKSPIGNIMREGLSVIDFENVLYLPELEGKIKNLDGEVNKKVLVTMRVAQNSALYNLIGACQNRFKPIYDKLLMPIIKLSKLGYNYLGDRLTEQEQKRLSGPEVKNWLAMVHVCEMFNKIIAIKAESGENEEAADEEEEDEDEDDLDEIFDSPDPALTEDQEGGDEPTGLAKLDSETTKVTVKDLGELEAQEELADKLERQVQERKELGWLGEGQAQTIDYQVSHFDHSCFPADGRLWVQSTRQLDLELSRKTGNSNPFGVRGFFRRAKSHIKRQFAKLDFRKFAHYRRHSAFYAGLLNFISALSNVASITTTLYFTIILL